MRRLSEYGSVAFLVERPTRERRAEQYSDTVLGTTKRFPETAPALSSFLIRLQPLLEVVETIPSTEGVFFSAGH